MEHKVAPVPAQEEWSDVPVMEHDDQEDDAPAVEQGTKEREVFVVPPE